MGVLHWEGVRRALGGRWEGVGGWWGLGLGV